MSKFVSDCCGFSVYGAFLHGVGRFRCSECHKPCTPVAKAEEGILSGLLFDLEHEYEKTIEWSSLFGKHYTQLKAIVEQYFRLVSELQALTKQQLNREQTFCASCLKKMKKTDDE